MALSYATPADYYTFLGYVTPPTLTTEQLAVLTSRLARASATVRSTAISNGAVYALDSSTRKPSDPQVLDAFRDAACALTAGLFDREGDGLAESSAPAEYDTISMAGVTLGKSTRRTTDEAVAATAAEARASAREREALALLAASGIFGSRAPRLT